MIFFVKTNIVSIFYGLFLVTVNIGIIWHILYI